MLFDTVVALTTPRMKAAMAVVRLSGNEAFSIFSKMVRKDVSSLERRKAIYGSIYQDKEDKNTLIDKCVYILFDASNSYTGEDSVEFYLHGSLIVVDELISTCIKYGAKQALGGEFSAKAYYHNKMDLIEAEGINSLINALTKRQKDFALKTVTGTNSSFLKELKEDLNLLEAEIEVDIDYPEYEESQTIEESLKDKLPKISEKAKSLLASSKRSKYLVNGIKVAIIGEPNVGKSTLLNSLIGYDKAIVSDIPGTTRDAVEGVVEYHGLVFNLFDTAGIRDKAGKIEKIGIEKSYKIASDADVILLLENPEYVLSDEKFITLIKNKPTVKVSTKKDIYGNSDNADVSISKDEVNIGKIFDLIETKLDMEKFNDIGLSSHREIEMLESFSLCLEDALNDLSNNMSVDVIEIKLLKASSILDELMGVSSTIEDVYSTIFKNFCVGK